MIRIVLVFLAALMVGAMLFGGAGGWLLLGPLFLFLKIGFVMMIFGSFLGFARPSARRSAPDVDRTPDREEFEEWHRLRHARDEVDGWVEGVL